MLADISVDLFTIISLMIGIFGATYTVIASIKNLFSGHVSRFKSKGQEQLKYLNEHKPGHKTENRIFKIIKSASFVWEFSFLIPVGVFAWYIFPLAFLVSNPETDINGAFSLASYQSTIRMALYIYLACIGTAIVAFLIIFGFSVFLNSLYKDVQGEQTEASLEKPEKSSSPSPTNGVQ